MPAHELVIRGGTVIDGTGADARTADVAVSGGVVTAVGGVDGHGGRELDADGLLVTPGFVDIHCHYDGQATWDDRLAPSTWHGVTTIVSGNCGVGFAPVRPADHGRLIELMEGVEDIPGTALHEGLSWDWQSFPEFLDALDGRPFDADIAMQVPHAAVRLHVMGERGAAGEPATPEDIAAMGEFARDGVAAGGLGFTTSRTRNHRTSRGEYTPTLRAEADELIGIAAAIGSTGAGVLQVVSDFLDPEAEFGILRRMVEASGRPLSFSLVQSPLRAGGDNGFRRLLELLETARADGLAVTAQVAARGIGILLGLQCSLHPFRGNPAFAEIASRPAADQARAMGDPDVRDRVLDAERNREGTGGLSRFVAWERVFELGDPPDYEPGPETSLAARAAAAGLEPVVLAYDLLAAGGGEAFLYSPIFNYADGDLRAVREMLVHPFAVVGLADGGAHVGTICDASFPTTLLAHWGRDRAEGRLPLPFLVRRQTSDTARTVGLHDRGVLAPGYRADVNLIDLERLAARRPVASRDLPAGGTRLLQRADGYVATVVAGEVTYEHGEPTGALPGRLARGDDPNPPEARCDPPLRGAAPPNPIVAGLAGARAVDRSLAVLVGLERRPVTGTASPPRTLEPLEPQCEWRAADVGDDYVWQLDDADLAELDAALLHAEAHVDRTLAITAELFPLPTLGPWLAALAEELIGGRGVALIRGVPVDRYGPERASAIYWGVGTHLGRPWPQNHKGHLLGDVTDQGRAPDDPRSRGNEIGGIAFPFHSDGSDLVGLFCLDAGASGGASLVANAVSIHNELVADAPDLAAALYDDVAYDFRGEQDEGARPWYLLPVFSRRKQRLFVRYIRPYIAAAARHADAPRPSAVAVEAMDRVDVLCADADHHLSMQLKPGDMQFVNNYHVLHARAAYEDDREHGRVRHLKRLWLETSVLTDDDKPEPFRLDRTTARWWNAAERL